VRRALTQMNGDQVMYDETVMDAIVSNSISARRFSMISLGVFAAVALFLASVGIYGVVAYMVTQRTHELGIRTALGAQQKDLLKLIPERWRKNRVRWCRSWPGGSSCFDTANGWPPLWSQRH